MAVQSTDEKGNTIVQFAKNEYFVAISKRGQKKNFFTHCRGFAYLAFAEIILSVLLKAEIPHNESAGLAILRVLTEKVMKRVYDIDYPFKLTVSTAEYSKALRIAEELENGRWK